jgi:periplasmic protein TonB
MRKGSKPGSVIALLVALSLSAPLALIAPAYAQETAPETVKRKVRSRTMPDYPAIAKQLKITGKVKLQATISADGHVVSTHVVGGSPVLVSACADALKKWRYEPGPKETSEVVEFDFDGN